MKPPGGGPCFENKWVPKVLGIGSSVFRVEKTENVDQVVNWLTKETGDRNVATRMVRTAITVGLSQNYPVPVVTEGVNGKVGVMLGAGTTFIYGYSLAVGDRN